MIIENKTSNHKKNLKIISLKPGMVFMLSADFSKDVISPLWSGQAE